MADFCGARPEPSAIERLGKLTSEACSTHGPQSRETRGRPGQDGRQTQGGCPASPALGWYAHEPRSAPLRRALFWPSERTSHHPRQILSALCRTLPLVKGAKCGIFGLFLCTGGGARLFTKAWGGVRLGSGVLRAGVASPVVDCARAAAVRRGWPAGGVSGSRRARGGLAAGCRCRCRPHGSPGRWPATPRPGWA